MHFISSGVSNGVKKKVCIYIYIYCDRGKNRETIPSSLATSLFRDYSLIVLMSE